VCSFLARTEFLITTSIDGHLKLWSKRDAGIEFVKHYRAHLAPVVAVSASSDGQLFASVSEDGTAKVFDVLNFGDILIAFPKFHRPSSFSLRYDQHDQVGLHTACVLLGSSAWTSSRLTCCVRSMTTASLFIHCCAGQTRVPELFGYTMDAVEISLWKPLTRSIVSPFI
jgi:WD40 repeat protein